jgi:cell division protein FtsN
VSHKFQSRDQMSPQSDKETRERIVERSEKLIQESRQLVEAAQAAMREKDSGKHRDTVGAARERTFQANNNPIPTQYPPSSDTNQFPRAVWKSARTSGTQIR